MSISHHHHVHFFQNKELNHFYFAIAIMTIGESLISIFVPIYLYKLNFEIIQILLYFLISSISFVLFAFRGAKIVSKIGVKHSMLLSTPFIIVYYIGLSFLPDYRFLFYFLPIIAAIRGCFYNFGYHLNFIIHSDRKKRAKEISFIGTITVIISIISPLIGGLIANFSFIVLYSIASIIVVLGTIPLFLTKDQHEKINFTNKDLYRKMFSRKERGTVVSFAGYAIETVIGRTIWPIFLILILTTLVKTGIVVSLSMGLSILIFIITGRIADKFNRVKLLKFATMFYFFAWVGRIFANTTLKIFLVDTYKNIAEKVLHIPWAAHSYDLAVRKGRYLFIVEREIIYNLSRVIFVPIIILIFYIDFYPFIISFATAALFSLGYSSIEN